MEPMEAEVVYSSRSVPHQPGPHSTPTCATGWPSQRGSQEVPPLAEACRLAIGPNSSAAPQSVNTSQGDSGPICHRKHCHFCRILN